MSATPLVLLLGAMVCGNYAAPAPMPRNLLFLQCDEMDGRVLDPGHPLWGTVQMPNLRRMAAEGINFVRSYADSPLCAPSRATMFTGRYTHDVRAWSNVKSLAAKVQDPTVPDPGCLSFYGEEMCLDMGRVQAVNTTIFQSMEAAGFNVSLHGKMDIGGGSMEWSHDVIANGYHGTPTWEKLNPGYYLDGDILHSWGREANISKPIFRAPATIINDHSPTGGPFIHDWHTVESCVEFLKAYKRTDPPFLLYCSVVDPHPPYFSNATWLSKVISLVFVPSVSMQRRVVRQVNGTALGNLLQEWPPFSEVHPAVRWQVLNEDVNPTWDRQLVYHLTHTWLGQVVETDHMMGMILDALASSEAAHDTMQLFTSDHGELHLEHRLVEKMSMYEGSARVPMLVRGPGVPQGKVLDAPVSLLDIFPTFLDAAGAPVPSFLGGSSLAPFLGAGMEEAWRRRGAPPRPDFVISQYHGEASNTAHFMIRSGRWKVASLFVQHFCSMHYRPQLVLFGTKAPFGGYGPQLFDLEEDMWEEHNLYDSNPAVARDLQARLRGVFDYEAADAECKAEGKRAAKLWTARYNDTWKGMIRNAYLNFEDSDLALFEAWLTAP